MEEKFDSIVGKWYSKLHRTFIDMILMKYKDVNISVDDAENIYQDIFIEIHRDIENGHIDKDMDWEKYIFSTGMQIVSKQLQSDRIFSDNHQQLLELLIQLPFIDNDPELYNNTQVQAFLCEELWKTPEPYSSIIRMKYYDNMSDEDISKVLSLDGKEKGFTECDINSVNSMLEQGLKDLSLRVKSKLRSAELIDSLSSKSSIPPNSQTRK